MRVFLFFIMFQSFLNSYARCVCLFLEMLVFLCEIALESVSATKAVLVDSEVESDGTSWKEESVFKKLFRPEPWVGRSELPRNDLETDPKQRCRKC